MKVLPEQPGLLGLCEVGEDDALITITVESEQTMLESLIEEWSHVLRHDTPVPIENEHDAIFWAIYGTVTVRYRGE